MAEKPKAITGNELLEVGLSRGSFRDTSEAQTITVLIKYR